VRPRPDATLTKPRVDLAERRACWRRLIAAGRAMAKRAEETQGREELEPDEPRHLAHALSNEGRVRFPIEGASADNLATAFRLIARAMLDAGTPRRREVIAPALEAVAVGLEQLITDELHAEAAVWKARMGEVERETESDGY
jgi:hypothetical protein